VVPRDKEFAYTGNVTGSSLMAHDRKFNFIASTAMHYKAQNKAVLSGRLLAAPFAVQINTFCP